MKFSEISWEMRSQLKLFWFHDFFGLWKFNQENWRLKILKKIGWNKIKFWFEFFTFLNVIEDSICIIANKTYNILRLMWKIFKSLKLYSWRTFRLILIKLSVEKAYNESLLKLPFCFASIIVSRLNNYFLKNHAQSIIERYRSIHSTNFTQSS